MPPRRQIAAQRPPPVRPGSLILHRRPHHPATLLIIYSITHLPHERIRVISWNRLRLQHENIIGDATLTRALTSQTSAAEVVRIFRDVIRARMRNPQGRWWREILELGDVLGGSGGGEVFVDPRAESVRKVLGGDGCRVGGCEDGWASVTVLEFEYHWPAFYQGLEERVKEVVREEDRVLCPGCHGEGVARGYLAAVVEVRNGNGGVDAQRLQRWQRCVRETNELRRQLGYSQLSDAFPQRDQNLQAVIPNDQPNNEGWEDWPEAYYRNPNNAAAWEHFPEALDPNTTTPTHSPTPSSTVQNLTRGRVTASQGTQPDNECHVCLETYQEGQRALYLRCGHYFHEECVLPWLGTWDKCPVCREAVRG